MAKETVASRFQVQKRPSGRRIRAAQAFYAVMGATQVLFALNRKHWLNEKAAVAVADRFPMVPVRFEARVSTIFGELRADPRTLAATLATLLELVTEVCKLSEQEGLV